MLKLHVGVRYVFVYYVTHYQQSHGDGISSRHIVTGTVPHVLHSSPRFGKPQKTQPEVSVVDGVRGLFGDTPGFWSYPPMWPSQYQLEGEHSVECKTSAANTARSLK